MVAPHPSLAGKVCIVTGATAGIGQVTAHALAQRGATVVIIGRDAPKAERVAWDIRAQTGSALVSYMVADLSSQVAIRQLAQQILSEYPHIDVLINNAGAAFTSRQVSVDGIEMTWALNHLAYFLLTNLLLERLKASGYARIINVSSDQHTHGKIRFDDLEGKQRYNGLAAYQQSKLANLLFTYELARRLEGTGVTVNALHPGLVATNLWTNNGFLGKLLRRGLNLFSISAEAGAHTSIYLTTSPDVEGVTGKYFVKEKAVSSSPASYDEAAARRLWEVSAAMTQLKSG